MKHTWTEWHNQLTINQQTKSMTMKLRQKTTDICDVMGTGHGYTFGLSLKPWKTWHPDGSVRQIWDQSNISDDIIEPYYIHVNACIQSPPRVT